MDRSVPDVDAGLVGGSVKGSRHGRRGGAVPRTPRPVACPVPFDWGPTQESGQWMLSSTQAPLSESENL